MSKTSWYFKQLLPLRYTTIYGRHDKVYLAIWRMWMGKCFKIKEYELAGKLEDYRDKD